MKFSVVVPTFNRPRRLSDFMNQNSTLLADLQIPLHIFHNELMPKYVPPQNMLVHNYFNSVNIGIQGNTRRILSEPILKDHHFIIASDEEILLKDGLITLLENNELAAQTVVFFNRKVSDVSHKWNMQNALNLDFTHWLSLTPFTETCYCIKIDDYILRLAASMSFFNKLPLHSYLLMAQIHGSFRGSLLSDSIFTEDIIGSVNSGWPSWIPNIITCNYVFLLFLLYTENITFGPNPSPDERALSLIPFSDYLPGLIFQLRNSIVFDMPSGIRLASAVYRLCMSRSSLLSDADRYTLESYYAFNLTYDCRRYDYVIKAYASAINAFKSSYPEWSLSRG